MTTEHTHGTIVTVPLEEEMKRSYIDYAMSVIVARALPDVRDGLKPVHRRILHAMREQGMLPDRPYKKAARIVGDVIAKYHPHGDAAVYDAVVRMAQDFTLRYPLIDGHGNFGSLDGDPPAAMRYTEVRLSPLAMEVLRDIDKDTVDFQPNFDEEEEEPVVLPARFPQLLVNGSAGIAVGMATNIPPHNLGEVIDGCVMLLDNPEVTDKELFLAVKGPDFPTGATIAGRDGIREAYKTGRGIIKLRAVARIDELSGGRMRILITELPYLVNKARLLERMAELIRDRKVEGVADLRDESDRDGVRVVLELRREANPRVILNQLYKFTQLEETYGIILLALVNGEPKVLSLREMLQHYLEHQRTVIVRRTRYELRKAEERAHILEGLRVALDHLDEVIALIRRSGTPDEARAGLVRQFGLTEVQAQAILDLRLQRLTQLEREKIVEEYQELLKTIEYLRAVLASERMVRSIIKQELLDVRERFADERRTRITSAVDEIDVEDLIAEEDVVITLTHRGYVKRTPASVYRAQRRGGRGVSGAATRDEDFVEHLFVTSTHHWMLFFSDRGLVYRLKAHELPEAGRHARGTALVNLLPLQRHERVQAVIPVREFEPGRYLLFATRQGYVKKTELIGYETSLRATGLVAIKLEDGDALESVRLTDGHRQVVLATALGMVITFDETDVRPMGRATRGVKGITLDEGDQVVAMDVVQPGADLLVVTDRAFGKRTPLEEYRRQARGGKGLKTIRLTHKSGRVVAVRVVRPGDELMAITRGGILIRMPADGIPRYDTRITQGNILMRLEEGDELVDVARVAVGEET